MLSMLLGSGRGTKSLLSGFTMALSGSFLNLAASRPSDRSLIVVAASAVSLGGVGGHPDMVGGDLYEWSTMDEAAGGGRGKNVFEK